MTATPPVPPSASVPAMLFPPCRGTRGLVFESGKTVEELKRDLRQTLGPVWDIGSAGPKGWVLGSWVRVGWLPRWTRYFQRCHLAFRGRVESTPTGSQLRGCIRANFLLTVIMAWWCFLVAGTVLFWLGSGNVRYRWELIIILACGILAMAAASLGARATVRHICEHLAAVCGSVPTSELEGKPTLPPDRWKADCCRNNNCLFEQYSKLCHGLGMKHFSSGLALREMAAAIGGTDVSARQWVDEGFSPGDAQAYVAAGCFDVGRTVALRQAGISALQMARSGLGWEYSSGSVSLAELLRLVQAAPTAQGALALG